MYRIPLLCIGLLLILALSAPAQFLITSSSPADGAVSVPLSTQISFTFNQPLDTTARLGYDSSFVALESSPDDLMYIESYSFSGDLRTVTLQVTLTANTDYCCLVMGARSQSQDMLSTQFCLNFTTAPTIGQRTITGRVTYEDATPPPYTLVGVFHRPMLESNGGPALVFNCPQDGDYTMHFIRDGVYWPVAVCDLNHNSDINMIGDLIALYDPDHDGHEDSIIVAGSNISNINLELAFLATRITARHNLARALQAATNYESDSRLIMVESEMDTLGYDGTSYNWNYYFYSQNSSQFFAVRTTSFTTEIDHDNLPSLSAEMLTVPQDYADSEVPMAVAEANGGSQYRAQNPVEWRMLRGGNLRDYMPIWPDSVFWMVEYGSNNTSWRCYINMLTGALIQADPVAVSEKPDPPQNFAMLENYPNPFNAITNLHFAIPVAGEVNLSVYDITGRLVEVLRQGFTPAGSYTISLNGSNLSSGIYFAYLRSSQQSQIHKMILLK